MKILVLNCGSSSIKYKLFDMTTKEVIAQGGIEKIGLKGSFLKLNNINILFLLMRLALLYETKCNQYQPKQLVNSE